MHQVLTKFYEASVYIVRITIKIYSMSLGYKIIIKKGHLSLLF